MLVPEVIKEIAVAKWTLRTKNLYSGKVIIAKCIAVMMFKLNHTSSPWPVRFFVTSLQCMQVDIRAAGFWGCHHHRSFFDVHVFNVFAESNQSTSLTATFRKHEGEKRRAYEERVWEVEKGSFTPLVFSSSGGMGKTAMVVLYHRLANLLSDKWNSSYSLTMGWLRCSLSFSLLHSSLMCLCGSHSSSGSPSHPAAIIIIIIIIK